MVDASQSAWARFLEGTMKKLIVAVLLSLCCLLFIPALVSPATAVAPVSRFAPDLAVLLGQPAELTASAPAAYDSFGHSIAVSGNTAIVGAFNRTVGGQEQAGAAYVFTRSGTTWTQQAKLTASDPALQDWFGYSVALFGDHRGRRRLRQDRGRRRLRRRRVRLHSLRHDLDTAGRAAGPTPVKYESFGESVAISGDTVLIGAPWKDGAYSRAGTAFVFTRSGTTWTQQAELLRSDTADYDYFGQSVALSGDTALLSVWGKNDFAGAADVFTRSGTTWTQQAQLSAPATDAFGWSVALSGDTALVGARQSTVGTAASAGNAYVFTRSGTAWTKQAELKAGDAAEDDEFGASVALQGNSAAVGAWRKTVPDERRPERATSSAASGRPGRRGRAARSESGRRR